MERNDPIFDIAEFELFLTYLLRKAYTYGLFSVFQPVRLPQRRVKIVVVTLMVEPTFGTVPPDCAMVCKICAVKLLLYSNF